MYAYIHFGGSISALRSEKSIRADPQKIFNNFPHRVYTITGTSNHNLLKYLKMTI